jgi:ABC-2 type transport system permease protein
MTALRRAGRLFWNPIVEKEMRSRMRTGRASLLISLYLATLGAVGYITYFLIRTRSSGSGFQASASAGSTIFRVLTVWELVLILFVGPALTAAAIAGERDRQTLDLLLCTKVRPSAIVVGKLVASLMFALLLLLASVPVFSVVLLFGGVAVSQVIAVAAILAASAVVIGALGLLCSTLCRRPVAATVFAYMLAFFYLALPLGSSLLFPATAFSGSVQSYVQIANPPLALGFTLANAPIRSPVQSSTPISPGSGSCVTISNTTNCTGAPGIFLTPQRAAPSGSDKIFGGIFRGWRLWEAFSLLSAIYLVALVSLSIWILSKKSMRVPHRKRAEAPRELAPAGEVRGA